LNETLKQKIILASQEIGIDKIGFTTADDFSSLEESLSEQIAEGHNSGFEHKELAERLYPEKIFDGPKSIISIALAYPTKIHTEKPKTGGKRGQFARASWGIDYHDILSNKLEQLIQKIRELADDEELTFKPMVDTGELIDVAAAQRAGLGFIGKNGLLITEEFGSFVYLGEIITNIAFSPDTPKENACGDCKRCLTNCPTGALIGGGKMNAKRCLSFQTQTKDYMPEEFRKKIRTTIYGCDICQLVCPYNKGKDFHFHPEMEPNINEVMPELIPMLSISNKQFTKQFGHLAGSWRGKKPLQRNAIIALANAHDKTAVPNLFSLVEADSRPVIRGTAAWTIGELLRKPSEEQFLKMEMAFEHETNEETKLEIRNVLRKWGA
jgi:epoxyqueuosine reductase